MIAAAIRRRHRADQDVAVLHVRQLVRDARLRALVVEQPAGCLRSPPPRRAADCGRSRTRWATLRNDIHARHRQSRALGEPRHDRVQPVLGPDLLRAVHAQDDLVREPVRHEVGARGEDEADHQPLCAAERLADEQQQRAQRRQEHRRLQSVGHGFEGGRSATPPINLSMSSRGSRPAPAPPPTGGFKDVLPGVRSHPILAKASSPITTPRADGKFQPPSRRASHQVTQATALKPPAPRFCLARIVRADGSGSAARKRMFGGLRTNRLAIISPCDRHSSSSGFCG